MDGNPTVPHPHDPLTHFLARYSPGTLDKPCKSPDWSPDRTLCPSGANATVSTLIQRSPDRATVSPAEDLGLRLPAWTCDRDAPSLNRMLLTRINKTAPERCLRRE